MCLAIPGRLVEKFEKHGARFGKVDFDGTLKEVCLEYLPDLPIGAYTLVHVGFAIEQVETEEALRNIELIHSMEAASGGSEAPDPTWMESDVEVD